MATTSVSGRVGLGVVLLVLVVWAAGPADSASVMTLFQEIGCRGNSLSTSECGCHNMAMLGGFAFSYDAQPAELYSGFGCTGFTLGTLQQSETSCGGLRFSRSFKIKCDSSQQ